MNLRSRFDKFDLFLVGLVITLYVVVGLLPFAPKKFGDGYYFDETKIISEAIHGARGKQEIVVSRAPGPVLFYAIPYSIIPPGSSNDQYWLAGLVWTMALICLSVLLVRRAATIIAGRLAGWLAALIALSIPLTVYYSYGVNAEAVAFIAAAIACYGWTKLVFSAGEKISIGKIMLTTCFGLTLVILARPNAILILLIGLFAAIWMFFGSTDKRRAILTLQVVVITGIVSISCLQIASATSGGGQQNNLSHVIFHGRFQYRTEPFDWRYWDDGTRAGSADYQLFEREQGILEARSEREATPLLQLKKEWAIRDAFDNPLITLQQAAIRCVTLHLFLINSKSPAAFRVSFVPGIVVYVLFHLVLNLTYLVVLGSSLYFVVANWRRAASYWVLWGVHPALLVFHALTYSEPRYMIPALPGLIILTGAVWGTLFNRLKN